MQLVEFQGQVGTKNAFAIRAKDLDGNFRRLKPLTNGQYGINETEAGWSLDIFPAYPAQTTETLALTYSGGTLQWRSLGEFVDESEGGNGGGTIGSGPQVPNVDELVVQTVEPSILNPEEPAAENYRTLVELLDTLTDEQKLTIINNWLSQIAAEDGGISVREVERCDGQRMKVLGTVWYSP